VLFFASWEEASATLFNFAGEFTAQDWEFIISSRQIIAISAPYTITLSGTLDATLNPDGTSYTAISGSGYANGIAITLVANPQAPASGRSTLAAWYDDQLYPGSTPVVDFWGLLFSSAAPNPLEIRISQSNVPSGLRLWGPKDTDWITWSDNIGRNSNFIGDSGSFTITPVSTVPIPAALWFLCSGLMGLIGVRRFRKQTWAAGTPIRL